MSTLIARFMGPMWGPPGAARTQVGPVLATGTLLSGYISEPSVLLQRPYTSSRFCFSACLKSDIWFWKWLKILIISNIYCADWAAFFKKMLRICTWIAIFYFILNACTHTHFTLYDSILNECMHINFTPSASTHTALFHFIPFPQFNVLFCHKISTQSPAKAI